MYQILRSLLFLMPAEKAHYFTMNLLKFWLSLPLVKSIFRARLNKRPYKQVKKVAGLNFKNPIGLAAGFDKNASYFNELALLGFGFVEIGTVTPLPQDGNEQPRLFRLPKDQALINRMGFNNLGVDVVVENLKHRKEDIIIGGNIGKNKVTANNEAVNDYLICFNKLFDYVDYFVVNVSSPNTPGLRELQEKDSLNIILAALQQENLKKQSQKPIFLKIAPDLTWEQIDEALQVVEENKLAGIITNNTTIDRTGLNSSNAELESIGNGGLSGAPLKNQSRAVLQRVLDKKSKNLVVISSGGVMTAEEIKYRQEQGADLVQIWTGFIYGGPGLIKRGLSKN